MFQTNKHSTSTSEWMIFCEGQTAFVEGKTLRSCPYVYGTVESNDWRSGFEYKRYDDRMARKTLRAKGDYTAWPHVQA